MKSIESDIKRIQLIDAIPSILEVVCLTTGMGFAAVARVTDTKWVTCAVRDEIQFGLKPGDELTLETTICDEIRQHHNPVIINHVAEDEAFKNHHTPAMYGFQSYISYPITLKNGNFFGTLCAIDPRPFDLKNPKVMGMFKLFAELIAFHLTTVDELQVSEAKLVEEQKTALLRDQFIAILGHDLRNPVGAVSNVAQLLLRMPLDERTTRLANILKDASYRMKSLIENVLDFARGSLGDGIEVNKSSQCIKKILQDIIDEMNLIWPERVIDVEFDLDADVNCDSQRLAQVFSNLLSNALTHGSSNGAIKVKAVSTGAKLEITVANEGKKIPAEALPRLFQPFSRGEIEPGKQGLGLGLYISSQIILAHGGELSVASTDDQTKFTLIIPA